MKSYQLHNFVEHQKKILKDKLTEPQTTEPLH